MSEKNPNIYYSADLHIPIVEIAAHNMKDAEIIMQLFIDKIANIMVDSVSWDEVDWTIEENILNEEKGEWITNG